MNLLSQVLPEILPPIVMFAFNRPDTLEVVLEALKKQTVRPAEIVVFLDGPRTGNVVDIEKVKQCEELLLQADGLNITLHKQTQNKGCNGNILAGLQVVTKRYAMFMVLEDDVVPNPYYYETMCKLLEAYKEASEVFSILPLAHGCYSDMFLNTTEADLFVTNRFNPQGYATWSDRWSNAITASFWEKLATKAYNPYGCFNHIPYAPHYADLLLNQVYIEHYQPDEWAVALVLLCLYNHKLHLCMRESMVYNIGMGHADATNITTASPTYNKRYNASFSPQTGPESLILPGMLLKTNHASSFLLRLRQYIRFCKYQLCKLRRR